MLISCSPSVSQTEPGGRSVNSYSLSNCFRFLLSTREVWLICWFVYNLSDHLRARVCCALSVCLFEWCGYVCRSLNCSWWGWSFFLLPFVMMEKYNYRPTHMGQVLPRNTKESCVVEITTPHLCYMRCICTAWAKTPFYPYLVTVSPGYDVKAPWNVNMSELNCLLLNS